MLFALLSAGGPKTSQVRAGGSTVKVSGNGFGMVEASFHLIASRSCQLHDQLNTDEFIAKKW